MSNLTQRIAPNVWAIITYEDSWKSYVNNYVIKKEDSFLLIDTNMRKHRAYLQQALENIGVTDYKRVQVFCTHRHSDHIGNVELFPSSNNWIHLHDYFELDDFSQTLFGHTLTGVEGEYLGLTFRNVMSHTSGSVAFFDRESGICFVGDHLSFFGAPMNEEQVVGYHEDKREAFYSFVEREQGNDSRQTKLFAEGIAELKLWPVHMLATGHGPILTGDIDVFFRKILSIIT